MAALDERIKALDLNPSPAIRALARRLFAVAIETPGGLKVQTIHAFCTRLLHQFPFEAGVAARFSVLDDATQRQVLETMTLDVMLEAAGAPGSALGVALETAITNAADMTFREVDPCRHRQARPDRRLDRARGLARRRDRGIVAGARPVPGRNAGRYRRADCSRQSLIPQAEWPAIAALLAQGQQNDREQAERFTVMRERPGRERLDILLVDPLHQDAASRARNIVTKRDTQSQSRIGGTAAAGASPHLRLARAAARHLVP